MTSCGEGLNILKEILGYKDIKMRMRYAHLSKEFAREEISIMNRLTSQNKRRLSHQPPLKLSQNVTKVSHYSIP